MLAQTVGTNLSLIYALESFITIPLNLTKSTQLITLPGQVGKH